MILCACGCGRPVNPARCTDKRRGLVKGQPTKFIHGHNAAELRTTHGATAGGRWTPEYRSYASMLRRCHNQHSKDYTRYGGRGIGVCERWVGAFAVFLSDMGLRPSAQHSIDRIDNSGNYEPANCRWATPTEQANNRRRRHATHCKNGHELTPTNTYVSNGKRRCRQCNLSSRRAKYAKDKVEPVKTRRAV